MVSLPFKICFISILIQAYLLYRTIFKSDVLFLKLLGKVIITKQQSFLLKWFFFFLHSHCLGALVLIWLSSCQPPYGNPPTVTISIFVVLIESTILREGVRGAGPGRSILDQWITVACEEWNRQHVAWQLKTGICKLT